MIAFIAMSLIALVPGADEVPLRWKLAEGDVFYSKTVVRKVTTLTVGERDTEQDETRIMYLKFKVISVEEKGSVLEQTFEKFEVIDSLDPISNSHRKYAGAILTLTVNDKFEVTKVSGMDKLIDRLVGDNSDTRKILSKLMKEDDYANMMTPIFRTAPDKRAKIGDKWTHSIGLMIGKGFGSFKVDTDYKFAESHEAKDKVTWTAKTKYVPEKDDEDSPISYKSGELTTGDFSGYYYFDSKSGRLKLSVGKATFTGTLKLAVNKVDVEMKVKQTYSSTCAISDKSLIKD